MSDFMFVPAGRVPVVDHADVVVCGGGPAGVAAAVAAARDGADVRLVELHGQLGGVWTSGLLCWILDSGNKGGVFDDLADRLRRVDGVCPHLHNGVGYQPEAMKLVLEDVCREAGVRVRLHTRTTGCDVAGGRINALLTHSKSGHEAFAGGVFIDASGDGDLAASAGCGFDIGRDAGDPAGEPGEMQPLTLMAVVGGVDVAAAQEAGLVRGGHATPRQSKDRLRELLHARGVEPSYGDPTLFPIGGGLLGLMTHHDYGTSGLDADDLTAATVRGRAEVHRVVAAFRRSGGPLAGLTLVATAAQVGVRDGRRVHGLYRVTAADAVEGRLHDDAVCRVTFNFDVHATRKAHGLGVERLHTRSQPFDIPYRALVARDVDNLLLAGRCISGDFLSHSAYRVTGNSVALGEAAGRAASLATREGVPPAEVTFEAGRPAVQAAAGV